MHLSASWRSLSVLIALAGCKLPDVNIKNIGDADSAADGEGCEPCDGIDNNGDGAIDEGYPDNDGDGIANCVDEETCDPFDNNGDGVFNEGFADTDGDGVADCIDPETCDGVDNNGDGQVDEGFDLNGNGVPDCDEVEICNCEDDDSDGEIDEGCTYTLSMTATVDDAGAYTLDGAAWFSSSGWSAAQTGTSTITAGTHHIAVTARDTGRVVAGFRAHVLVDGALVARTGDGDFYGTATAPASGWETTTAGLLPDTSATCTSTVWPAMGIFTSTGADWVWFGNCQNPAATPNNWYVLEFEVCGATDIPEVCDGVDNDMDGETDEGFPDTDGDGVCDEIDGEECDGLDNDGDGDVDEGYTDTDGDGVCDEIDPETCDGQDNNGDGAIDEGYPDTDGDGTADCIDEEECDGLDNDGDGDIDEGMSDVDGDGICDDLDPEVCDGVDNDGDGDIDEGMSDVDGDGICDDIDSEDCDGIDNDGDGLVDEGYPDTNRNGIADCIEEETDCDCVDNNGNGLVDENCEYELSMVASADDRFTAYLDGSSWITGFGWSSPASGNTIINGGTHHIAAYAKDVYRGYAGYRAEVSVDGALVSATGDGSWLGSATYPGAGWETSTAGLGAELVQSCSWGALSAFTGGSDWIWSGSCSNPSAFSEGWFVLELEVCGPEFVEELCNGVDDDGDGVVDEDYADTDGDGTADCVDTESCFDYVDNDGDGEIDEDCYGDCGAIEGTVNTCIIEGGYFLYCTDTSVPMPVANVALTSLSSFYRSTWSVDMTNYRTMIVEAPLQKVSQWGLHIGNSSTNDGYGGDAGTTWHDSEFFTFGTGAALYSDDFGGSAVVASLPGVIDLNNDFSYTVVCDGYLGFQTDSLPYTDYSSPNIFQIDGDESDPGSSTGLNDRKLWLGLNRTIGSTSRVGQGTSYVKIHLVP